MLVRLPKTLNGGLTLNNLRKLAKQHFEGGFRFISYSMVDMMGNRSIDKSCWVLMTKNIVPGSRSKSYTEQQRIVAGLAEKSLIGYQVPEALEAAACILSQYFALKIRLFSDAPLTYTRCKENIQGLRAIVGGFYPSGLEISNYPLSDTDPVGVAALRKF
jgi:hypothetical protein